MPGKPCDKEGNYLPPNTPPPPPETENDPDDWTPYRSRAEFELADFLYTREQMSAGNIDELLGLWEATLAPTGADPLFTSHKDVYSTIDSTPLGDCPWETFSLQYNGEKPTHNTAPSWMTASHDAWFRNPRTLVQNLIANPDFNGGFDYAPLQEYDTNGNHQFQNYMSGNWSWKQAVHVFF